MADKRISELQAISEALGTDLILIRRAGYDRQATISQVLALINSNIAASGVSYDNTASGISADNVKDALDYLANGVVSDAENVNFANAGTGFIADNVQAALEELEGRQVTWGNITGLLSDQTDLNDILLGLRSDIDNVTDNQLGSVFNTINSSASIVPAAVDVPENIDFDAATSTDFEVDGVDSSQINTLEDGKYKIKAILRTQKTTATNASTLIYRIMVNGSSVAAKEVTIVGQGNSVLTEIVAPIQLATNDTINIEILADSSSIFDTGLVSFNSTVVGYADIPTAQVIIERI